MTSRVTRDSPWQMIESIIEAETVTIEPSLTCKIPLKLAFSIRIAFIDGDSKAMGQSLIRAVESISVALGMRTRPADESGQPTMVRFDKMLMPVENRGGLSKKEREVAIREEDAHGEADQNAKLGQLRKLELTISMCLTWFPKAKPPL